MNDLNSLYIEGTISNTPNVSQNKKGDPVCTFSISSCRFYKGHSEGVDKDISTFEVETWEAEAEKCQRLGHKGRRCRIRGRIRQDRWNTLAGDYRSKVVIVAESVEFRPEHNQEGKEHDD
jgi:single-strand DNA-binding protein